MLSARELSIGMTKLSGSNPFLKVAIAIAKDIITIIKTAIRFVVSKSRIKLRKPLFKGLACVSNDKTAYIMNIISDAAQVVRILGACFLIEEKKGLTKPMTNFVVAVDPTTEPTSPTVSINAGYTVKISFLLLIVSLICLKTVPVTLTITAIASNVERVSSIVLVNCLSWTHLGKMTKVAITMVSPKRATAILPKKPSWR
jgi:hypothetical protein